MGPDSRVLLAKGRKAAEKYKLKFGDSMPVSQLTKDVASVMQEYTQSGGVRPFGCSLLVAGFDHEGPRLYQVSFFFFFFFCYLKEKHRLIRVAPIGLGKQLPWARTE
jgi:hypothetical protein